MKPPGRFERLEARRTPRPALDGADAREPSALDRRFGSAPSPVEDAAGTPSDHPAGEPRHGGERARFENASEASPLRVLEMGAGQPFVRCAHCRADSHATAVTCKHCDADLTTREQRAFNEALWKHHLEEQAEEDRELERLRMAREEADRNMAEAFRRRGSMEAELARRRALGLPLDEADDVRNPLEAGARLLGRALGRWIRRALPARSSRIAFMAVAAILVVFLLAVSSVARWALCGLALLLLIVGLAAGEGRGNRG